LYSEDEGEVFLGRQVTQHKNMSDITAGKIDVAIKKIIDHNFDKAYKLLTNNMDILHSMAKALMKYETIDAGQIDELMKGKAPTPPEDWVDEDDDTPIKPSAPKHDNKEDESKKDGIGGEATSS
jgi:cell division protease FtsH